MAVDPFEFVSCATYTDDVSIHVFAPNFSKWNRSISVEIITPTGMTFVLNDKIETSRIPDAFSACSFFLSELSRRSNTANCNLDDVYNTV